MYLAENIDSITHISVARTAVLLVFCLAVGGEALAQVKSETVSRDECGSLAPMGDFGPFDYRRAPPILATVEHYHFNADVEQLVKGETGSSVAADIVFVLHHFPNHPRALAALARLAKKTKSERPPGADLAVSCFFLLAIDFVPDDPKVREIYGLHLWNFGKRDAALAQLKEAEKLGATDANTAYNLGLIYYEKKDYENALQYAKKAYAQGFPLPGLKTMLKRVGKWED